MTFKTTLGEIEVIPEHVVFAPWHAVTRLVRRFPKLAQSNTNTVPLELAPLPPHPQDTGQRGRSLIGKPHNDYSTKSNSTRALRLPTDHGPSLARCKIAQLYDRGTTAVGKMRNIEEHQDVPLYASALFRLNSREIVHRL